MDAEIEKYLENGPNLLVPWYLILSYAYYILDETLASDGLYDEICRRLLAAIRAGDIDHMHADLCDEEALTAGTAYHLAAYEYPSRVVVLAHRFAGRAISKELIPW